MTDTLIFTAGLSLIIMHEMDAVRCREWRIFPGLSRLDDKAGYRLFMLAHIPIFTGLFWQLFQNPVSGAFRVGFDLFLIIHLVLHLLLRNHKNNEFRDGLSWSIITGAALCGLLDLVLY